MPSSRARLTPNSYVSLGLIAVFLGVFLSVTWKAAEVSTKLDMALESLCDLREEVKATGANVQRLSTDVGKLQAEMETLRRSASK